MKFNETNSLFEDFLLLWQLLKKNWKWIPVSLVACLVVAFLYLKITPSTLKVTGKMELIDKSKNGSSGMSAGMALLNSLPMGIGSSLGGGSLGIDSEKEILMSNILVRNVVKDLGLYTEYRLSNWYRNTLLYQDNPIIVSLDSAHVQWFDEELPLTNHQIQLTINKNNTGYRVKVLLTENGKKTKLPTQSYSSLPAVIETDFGKLTIKENILSPKIAKAFENNYKLIVTISPPTNVADDFIARLTADPPKKTISNILNISLQDENQMQAIDFINHLVEAYNKRANDEKNEEARKTDEFVDGRLAKIDLELGSSDDAWESSKQNYQITSPEVDAQVSLSKKNQYEAQLVEMGTKLQLHDYLSDYIDEPDNIFELIPIGMLEGSSDSQGAAGGTGTASFIAQHNTMVKQRNNLMKSVSEKSPQLQRLSESIKELHPTIQLAMKRDREQLVIQKNTLEREYARYLNRIGSAPQMERVFTEIGRLREIKQAVYLLLLQKREETAMELANTTDKGRLIDEVRAEAGSTKPHKKIIFVAALFIGAILPMVILFLRLLFKTKIDKREELEALTYLPFLSEIPTSDTDEAIRNLRTCLLLNLKPDQKVILVTSQREGDGKSFISQHLTDSFNAIGKKTLYVNADLRKIEKDHPADIFASDDFAQKMAQAKAEKDYVIIDSSAIGKYVDAFQLAQFADATLYVVKAGTTVKSDIESLSNETRLPQPMLILNKVN